MNSCDDEFELTVEEAAEEYCRRASESLEATRYHEAGHAIVSDALGVTVQEVMVYTGGKGFVKHDLPDDFPAEKLVSILMGGFGCQEIYNKVQRRGNHPGNLRDIKDIMRAVRTLDFPGAVVSRAYERSKNILIDNDAAVKACVKLLEETGDHIDENLYRSQVAPLVVRRTDD